MLCHPVYIVKRTSMTTGDSEFVTGLKEGAGELEPDRLRQLLESGIVEQADCRYELGVVSWPGRRHG